MIYLPLGATIGHMNEAMTHNPTQPEVNAMFDDMMAQQMAMDGMMDAVRAMQNIDMTSDTLMQDAAQAVAEESLTAGTLSLDDVEANAEIREMQLMARGQQAAAAAENERLVADAVNRIFEDADDSETVDA